MHLVILGNGITGATAALRARELDPDCRITLVSGESPFPFSRPALMYIHMGHMRFRETKLFEDRVWAEQRIDLVQDWATELDFKGRRVSLAKGEALEYDRLLLALGSKPNKFGWPGQDLGRVGGLYTLMDLERVYRATPVTKRVVVVGGGLIGIELAEMFHTHHVPVTLLVREDSYWSNVLPPEESAMVNRVIRDEGFDLRLGAELAEIHDDGTGNCGAVTTKDGERIECQFVGLTAGVSPNLDLVRESALETGRGILVDDGLETSIPGVFAAGDCAEIRRAEGERNLLQQVWYTGKAQGAVAAAGMVQAKGTYDPGIWFNSAKFLDLEYQTYGFFMPSMEGLESVYWEDPKGLRAVRIVHAGGAVKGFNFMGVRARHRVCERWLAEGASLEHVVSHLSEAAFDPEFSRGFAEAVFAHHSIGGTNR